MPDQSLIEQAIALESQGQLEEAAVVYELVVADDPGNVMPRLNLANVLRKLNRLDDAETVAREAIELRNQPAMAWGCLAGVLWVKNRKQDAVDALRTALSLDPTMLKVYVNLIAMLRDTGQIEEAVDVGEKALKIDPNSAEVLSNLAYALKELGRVNEALTMSARAVQIKPDFPHGNINHGFILLLSGDYPNGFAHREKYSITVPTVLQRLNVPHWAGQSISGKRLLVFAREGAGDMIMYARYLPILVERGITVIAQVPPSLARLFRSIAGVEIIESLEPVPEIDYYCAFSTLPLLLKTQVDSIPNAVPYLHVAPELKARVHERLKETRPKVGLVWSGNAKNTNDPLRSIATDLIRRFSQVENVQFFSLQKENSIGEDWIIDLSSELNDFADTAAYIEAMDLVISVDTAVAHLAGALAKPVWIMQRFAADWRWMLDREDSPWYPTARLIRQKTRGDWASVIDHVISLLREQP